MPNVRSAGQTMIGCWVDAEFVRRLDRARGGLSRSQFCRDALKEKLASLGIAVEDLQTAPPDRAGKGGPKRRPPADIRMGRGSGKPVSSKLLSVAEESGAVALKKVLNEAPSSSPSRKAAGTSGRKA